MTAPTGPHAPRVVLVGPPGAGKSTIGRKLARELGVPLYDTDAGIEQETGRTIPEIFADDGEPEFRRIEERVVRRAVLDERGVVSLGGGAVLSENTRALLRERTVVYLEISVAEGLRRTGASTGRPLLNGADPGAKYRELMRIRRPLYREVSSIRVRTDGRSPGRVVRAILAELGVESIVPEPTSAAPAAPGVAPRGSRSRARRRARARAAARRTQDQPVAGENTGTGRASGTRSGGRAGGTTRAATSPTAPGAGPARTGEPADRAERVTGERQGRSGRRRTRRVTAGGRRGATGAPARGDAAQPDTAASPGAGTGAPARGAGSGGQTTAGRVSDTGGSRTPAGSATPTGAATRARTDAAGTPDQPNTTPVRGSTGRTGSAEPPSRARRARARRARARAGQQTARTESEHT